MLLEMLETMTVAVSCFLVKKYVTLEPDMEPKKQRIFYFASFLLTGTLFFIFGKDAATLAALFMVGLNICLARKKYRLLGLCSTIPILGVVNGIFVPILFVPPHLCAFSECATSIYQFSVYGVFIILFALFYVKGQKWRNWFNENIQHRTLRKSENYLLYVVGLLMLFFSNGIAQQLLEEHKNMQTTGPAFSSYIGIITFVMTITIIVLIMQGNMRSFYYERVSNMQSSLIAFMAEVVENRDDNTGGHIKRTARYVQCIANELKKEGAYSDILTDKYIADMVVAAPMHDIGKIHIPDAVLNKPGKLTNEEFEIMKTHTTAGENLLKSAKEEFGESNYLTIAMEMAAYHHERWDGKGYPYGISGENIPLCARIMAVADVFDALTSRRCYKNAMPLEKAYSIIREESGSHFDPKVVEAFFTAANQGMCPVN